MAKYIKGIVKDTGHVDQPEGSYRYAKNAVISKVKGAILNEHGNVNISSLVPSIYPDTTAEVTVIGSIEITDDRVVFFARTASPDTSIIFVLNTDDTTTLVFGTTDGNTGVSNPYDLKFSKDYPIEGTYKIDPDGNLIVYWTDNYNPPRSLNVTRQIEEGTETKLYGVDPATSPNKNYIERLNLFPHAGPVPRIKFNSISNGGALKTGAYYLFLAYVDKNFTQTNYVTYSLGVPIVDDDETVLPIERYDGADADTQTGKSIVWDVSNLNTDYEYLRPVVVAKIGDNAQFAYRLNDLDISGDTGTVVFSGLEGYQESAVEDVLLDTVTYDTAKTITQLDGRMYLGNLTSNKDIGFQKHANFIKLEAVVDTIDRFDEFKINNQILLYGRSQSEAQDKINKENGFRGINRLASTDDNRRGYTRDEVYAFYIAFILNDGSMSYAYHIPGREPLYDISTNSIGKVGGLTPLINDFQAPVIIDETSDIPEQELKTISNNNGKVYHFYDTSKATDANGDTLNLFNTGYWNNKNEQYPETDDYKVFDGLTEKRSLDLRGRKVRHHKMPSNATVGNSFIDAANIESTLSNVSGSDVYYIVFSGEQDTSSFSQFKFNTFGADKLKPKPSDQKHDVVVLPNSATQNAPALAYRGPFTTTTISGTPTNVDSQARKMFDELQDNLDDAANWKETTPRSGQEGYFIWSKGPSQFTNTGGSTATIIDKGEEWHVEQDGGDVFGVNRDVLGSGFDNIEYGLFVWYADAENVDKEHVISHRVKPLGVKLSDIKIPKTIADKVQGFRIYYAERTHANRRVLGQDIIKNTRELSPWDDADVSGCGTYKGVGSMEAYILSPGTLFSGRVSTATFHDTYLLNRRHSLIPATHTTFEYNVDMIAYRGPGKWYSDVKQFDSSEEEFPAVCQDTSSFVSYFVGGDYQKVRDVFYHYPLREKCKTYINGDSIFDGTSLGFGKKIYNLGGESSVVLGYTNTRQPRLGTWPDFTKQDEGRPEWAKLPPEANSDFSFSSSPQPNLQLHTLHAFKNDMYLSYDSQNLVWTGYEVLKDELDNFVLKEDGTSPANTGAHTTDNIFGGDTFIARQGYRITHRPEIEGVTPKDHKSIIYTMCESTMNVNFRHETSVDNSYYPGSPAGKILGLKANVNLTAVDDVKYENHYSLGTADVKAPVPFPLRESDPKIFNTRVQRSAKTDSTSLIDNYRVYLALDFKDLPRNRGELWKLVTFNNLLYMHTEDSLFRTKGKESLQLADGAQSFIGSGDIFVQDPDEMLQTEAGFGGTNSQWASLVTQHGYFCLDHRNAKVFLVKDQMYDIGRTGLQDWFRDNIPFALESYGVPAGFDNNIQGIGFHAVYDERYSRILLTKNDLKPTAKFIGTTVNVRWDDTSKRLFFGQTALEWDDTEYFTPTGWTVSFDPELNVWVSFHDYVPYFYSYRKDDVLSITRNNKNIWEHRVTADPGNFYGVVNPFEFEFIFNASRDDDKVFYSFNYISETYKDDVQYHNPGFTKYYLYGVDQISGEQDLEYMMNIRRVGNEWKVNKFRDVAKLEGNTADVYTGGASGHTGSNFGVTGANVAGSITTSVETTTNNSMFTVDGMNETINNSFIDTSKSWHKRKKFTGKWLGVRLIANNSSKNLINLYATDVAAKKFYR